MPDKRVTINPGQVFSLESGKTIFFRAINKCELLVVTNDDDDSIDLDMVEPMKEVIAVEKKDRYLVGHNTRVANYTIMQKDADEGKIDTVVFEALKQLVREGYIIKGVDDAIHTQKTDQ